MAGPNIFITTPMYGGQCHGSYAASLLRLTPIFMNARVPFQFAYRMNESLITRARDSLAADFLATDCTHLMFIDADIGFAAEDILPMIAADKDIICGVYPRKEINWERVAEAVNDGVAPEDLHKYAAVFVVGTVDGGDIFETAESTGWHQPIEIMRGGCGFMLIKREVLEGLADKVPEYDNGSNDVDAGRRRCRQYFDTSIDADDNDLLLSEDFHFCKLTRDNGYQVWAAPWVELTHSGSYQWRGITANKMWAAPREELANAGVH